jgi:Heterokaryon incompatibility protein (HET)
MDRERAWCDTECGGGGNSPGESLVGPSLCWRCCSFGIERVCICQTDIEERNDQLSIIGKIYEEADCVLVLLALSTRETNNVFQNNRHRYLGLSYFWSVLNLLHIYELKSPAKGNNGTLPSIENQLTVSLWTDSGQVDSMLFSSNLSWFSRV